MKNNIAIVILARGGSKRILKKSILPIAGSPLIDYTVKDAVLLGSYLKAPIYIYTDMKEIMELYDNDSFKEKNVFVRNKLFENEEGIHHTSKELIEYNEEFNADNIILFQLTSPLRDVDRMRIWVRDFLASNKESGFAAYKVEDGYYYNQYGRPINYIFQNRTYNQDKSYKTQVYKETGSFYIFKTSVLHRNHFMNSNSMVFDDPYNIDINNESDLAEVERLLNE